MNSTVFDDLECLSRSLTCWKPFQVQFLCSWKDFNCRPSCIWACCWCMVCLW